MTPQEKQMMDEVDDLGRFASVEAVKRISQVADVMPDRELKLMVGLRASRSLFMSYVLTAVQSGMPIDVASSYICGTMDQLGRLIVEAAEGGEEE